MNSCKYHIELRQIIQLLLLSYKLNKFQLHYAIQCDAMRCNPMDWFESYFYSDCDTDYVFHIMFVDYVRVGDVAPLPSRIQHIDPYFKWTNSSCFVLKEDTFLDLTETRDQSQLFAMVNLREIQKNLKLAISTDQAYSNSTLKWQRSTDYIRI